MEELTKKEIERQDFVDSQIYELIIALNPSTKEIDWNIEMIGDVRDAISYWIVDRLELCTEKEFYSYIEE